MDPDKQGLEQQVSVLREPRAAGVSCAAKPTKRLQHVESHTLLCLRLMDLPVIHIEAQPSQQSKEEKGKGFTCHISTKTRYSKVTKLTEIANEEGAQRITGGSILNTS